MAYRLKNRSQNTTLMPSELNLLDHTKIQNSITAFIDILGFGNRVLSASSFVEIQAIESALEKIRNEFDCETTSEITKRAQQISGTEVLAFSDSIVVNIPLASISTKCSGTFDPIISDLTCFAYSQDACIFDNVFIRGGVDIGWWYHQQSTLISQSLTRAYQLEGNTKFPIISITDQLHQYLVDHPDRGRYSSAIDPIPRTFREYWIDGVRRYHIDYIRICVEEVSWTTSRRQLERYHNASEDEQYEIIKNGYREKQNRWLKCHAERIKTAHSACDQKNKEKYKWLEAYHNEVAEKYTNQQDCFCRL